MLCRDRCGYCTFAKPPARLDHPYLPLDEVLAIARAGVALGCHEALFTLGEGPEDRYPVAGEWLAAHGHATTVDYLVEACRAVLEETGLLPHANAGALGPADLERLRAVSPSQGMMLESLADRLHEPGGPHFGAPDKTADRRLATLEAAGRARIPFTTGILVGFGETLEERLDALARDPGGARASRSRAGSHRAELPPEAGHQDVDSPIRAIPSNPVEPSRRTRDAAARDSPAGAAEPDRPISAPDRGRDRRLGWRLSAHRRPRQPRTALARPRPAPGRDRGRGQGARARLTVYPEYV